MWDRRSRSFIYNLIEAYLKQNSKNALNCGHYLIFIKVVMGITRSKADVQKFTVAKVGQGLSYAVTSMCGWRDYMEDGHICESPLKGSKNSLFGVFDGHYGPEVAVFAERNFTRVLETNENYQRARYRQALKETFLNMDTLMSTKEGRREIIQIRHEMRVTGRAKYYEKDDRIFKDELKRLEERYSNPQNDSQRQDRKAGCAANVVLITPEEIYCANAGDCRTAASVAGECFQLSHDHKPDNPQEKMRIQKAGCYVSDHRINDQVNLSRGFGDFHLKISPKRVDPKGLQQGILKHLQPQEFAYTANPDIITLKNQNIDFIIMGCDGIWEQRSHQDMVAWVQKQMNRKISNEALLEQLLDETVANETEAKVNRCIFGVDNMSAILIQFGKK